MYRDIGNFPTYGWLPLTLLVLSFGVSFPPILAEADEPSATIVLAPMSDIRFFDCQMTPTEGSFTLQNLSAEESAQSALTDGDLDTIVMGSAILDISLSSNLTIVNNPGAELMLVEMAGAEPINGSISDSEVRDNKSVALMPTLGNYVNTCGMAINYVFVDLSTLGVPEGASVSTVRFDNLGEADSLLGADVAEIVILDPETTDASDSSQDK